MLSKTIYKYINLYYLIQMSDDDDFMREMIEIYRSQVPIILAMLEKQYSLKNISGLRDAAHKSTGAMAVLGITCLNEKINYLEETENILLSEFATFIQSYIFTCNEVNKELDLVLQELKP